MTTKRHQHGDEGGHGFDAVPEVLQTVVFDASFFATESTKFKAVIA